MIPIRDTIQSRNYPLVNTVIIALNVLFFLIQAAQGAGIERFIFTYGLVPARYSVPEIGAYFTWGQQAFAFFSFLFLHGDFWHLLGNMWFLYIFGEKVEDRLGSVNYLAFYLLCGMTSGLIQLLLDWSSKVPTIGASGAISGVIGAYLLLCPRSKILTLIPIIFIPYFLELPASLFVCIWLIIQVIGAVLAPSNGGGIAWWAHIGGFVFGFVLVKLFLNIPETDLSRQIRGLTFKRRTPRLQVVRIKEVEPGPNLHGFLAVTTKEARLGTHKLINVPRGFKKRLFQITIPAGIQDGTILRLRGLGRQVGEVKGDLHLEVRIHEK